MRFYDKTDLKVSADTADEPKQVRLSEASTDTDVTLLKEIVVRQETFPVGTHSIGLGNIAAGKWLLVKPLNDLAVTINGSATPLTVRGSKVSRMWVTVTSLSITVSGASQEVLIAVAGE